MGAGRTVLEPDYRLFLCARCGTALRICSCCDRGHRYCAPDCAALARTDSLRRARRRYYRNNPDAQANNAEGQRRFRARRRQAVKDQGSPPSDDLPTVVPAAAEISSAPVEEVIRDVSPQAAEHTGSDEHAASELVRCDFCDRPCRPVVRHDFRRRRRREALRALHWLGGIATRSSAGRSASPYLNPKPSLSTHSRRNT